MSKKIIRKTRVHRPLPIPNLAALPDDVLLTRDQVARLANFTGQALKLWAKVGRGPTCIRVEGRPRYRARDVRAWLDGQSSEIARRARREAR